MGKAKGKGTSSSPTLQILNYNAGPLTNFEVLDFLRTRGATSDPSRILSQVAPSELKVYDYLVKTPACNQTREMIKELADRCKEEFDLAKAEVLCLINLRTSTAAEANAIKAPRGIYVFICFDQIIEKAEERELDLDKVVDLVTKVIPPHPGDALLIEKSKEVQQAETEHQDNDEIMTG